ncbi:GNAT family N-acetyltransferase [Devosia sp. 2618]|uniref:GNAT family N-acetyltransferase n=1 Tax=Devosia sp. 2618 TaxID=3156454 RepID=UPI0033959F0D
MVEIRPYRADDLDALYQICLLSGDAGRDATPLYNDPNLLGAIYSAPYGVLEPQQVFVADDELGVAGYIVGTFDSDAFSTKLERDWWPHLREQYAASDDADLTAADQQRLTQIRQPSSNPSALVADFPAHIHMNLHERLRGQGVGTQLLKRWIADAKAANVAGIHLGANSGNTGGVAFWTRSGFVPQVTIGRTVWFGMTL